jgi:nucleotide-binding universal stress UspA family protein
MRKLERILVPIDFSPSSADALRAASLLARAAHARIEVLHVAPFQPPLAAAPGDVAGSELFEATARAELESELDAFVSSELPKGVAPPETRVVFTTARPSAVIIGFSPMYDAIVIGTHGRTGLERARAGSVAAEVTQKAVCPVVAVRGERRPREGEERAMRRVLDAAAALESETQKHQS